MNLFRQLSSGRFHLLLFAFVLMTSCQMNFALYYSGRKGSYPRLGKRNEAGPVTDVASLSDYRDGRPNNKILRRLYEIIGRLDRQMTAENYPKSTRSFPKLFP